MLNHSAGIVPLFPGQAQAKHHSGHRQCGQAGVRI